MRDPNFDINLFIDYIHNSSLSNQEAIDNLYPGMDWTFDVKGVEAEALDDKIFLCYCCGIWRYVDNRKPESECCTICKINDE